MPIGNVTGVTPLTSREARKFIHASEFGGVAANSWRPENTSVFIYRRLNLPDMFPRSGMKIYVHWSTSNTGTSNTVTWRVRYNSATPESTDSVNGTFSALDTTIAADSPVGTANAFRRTAAGVLAPGRLVPDDFFAFEVGVTATSGITLGDTDNVQFFALELRYAQHSV